MTNEAIRQWQLDYKQLPEVWLVKFGDDDDGELFDSREAAELHAVEARKASRLRRGRLIRLRVQTLEMTERRWTR